MAYDEKQKEYTLKYLEKLKEIRFRVKPEEFEVYEKAAQKAGYPSMRQFYLDALQEKVEKILNQCANPIDIQRTIVYNIDSKKASSYKYRKGGTHGRDDG